MFDILLWFFLHFGVGNWMYELQSDTFIASNVASVQIFAKVVSFLNLVMGSSIIKYGILVSTRHRSFQKDKSFQTLDFKAPEDKTKRFMYSYQKKLVSVISRINLSPDQLIPVLMSVQSNNIFRNQPLLHKLWERALTAG